MHWAALWGHCSACKERRCDGHRLMSLREVVTVCAVVLLVRSQQRHGGHARHQRLGHALQHPLVVVVVVHHTVHHLLMM